MYFHTTFISITCIAKIGLAILAGMTDVVWSANDRKPFVLQRGVF
jgi:hypothetical protein